MESQKVKVKSQKYKSKVKSEEEKFGYMRVEAPCPYFGTCGGCTLQDLAYEDQVALKTARVRRAFASIDEHLPIEVVRAEDPWRYRNKAELAFGSVDGELVLGYHAAKSFWRVVDLADCLLLPEPMSRLIGDIRRLAQESGYPPYHSRTRRGFFRYVTLRMSQGTGQLMVCLTTAPGPREVIEQMAQALHSVRPDLASVFWGITRSVADVAVPEALHCMVGSELLEERIGPFQIAVHPLTFLQPNIEQAQRLYRQALHALDGAPTNVAWDLYCGTGLVAFHLASTFRQVHGIDAMDRNIALATHNASRNRIPNVRFHQGAAEELLMQRRFWLQEAAPDVVVIDPPRAGMHERVLSSVLAARPSRIVYLSCNLATLIRDLRLLLASYPRYRVREAVAFDMFPQTNHVELLVSLAREV
jgi:23S rRNA (uracil1939-C5)-methyltransferase